MGKFGENAVAIYFGKWWNLFYQIQFYLANNWFVNSNQRYQDYNFNTLDAGIDYISLISEAQIKIDIKPNKYQVEKRGGPKISQKMCQKHSYFFTTFKSSISSI